MLLEAPGQDPSWPRPASGSGRQTSAFLGLQTLHSSLCLCLHLAFLCVSMSPQFLSGHTSLALGPILNPGRSHLEILNFITSAKILFSNKVTFIHMYQGLGLGHIFGREEATFDPLQHALCFHFVPPNFPFLLFLFFFF